MRADIHDGREQSTLPSMGRIQMRETNYLQIATSSLHRTAGPYRNTWPGGEGHRRRAGGHFCATMRTASLQLICSWCRRFRSDFSMVCCFCGMTDVGFCGWGDHASNRRMDRPAAY